MKHFLYSLASMLVCLSFMGCYGIVDQGLSGHLEIKKNSGWSNLEFKDGKTGAFFALEEGDYTLAYEKGIYGYRYPMIAISDKAGTLIGRLEIPRKSIRDDGSFEIYTTNHSNTNSFNILGGFRKIIANKRRYAKLKEYCVYNKTYPCKTSDGKGGSKSSTCTRRVSGHQDEIWEHHDYQNNYRIIFDGADLMNVAIFKAKGQILSEDILIGHESCE